MQRVRLIHLSVVHQAAELLRGGRQILAAHDAVHGLGRSQMVADRADTTQALDENRDFPEETPLDETLEAAKLGPGRYARFLDALDGGLEAA